VAAISRALTREWARVTRATGDRALGQAEARELQVTGQGGVPADGVTSVVLNVTVDAPTTPAHLSLSRSGEPLPHVSNLNFLPGEVNPDLVVVPLGDDGSVSVDNDTGDSDVVIDIFGFSTP
jgi:hypothetical protein